MRGDEIRQRFLSFFKKRGHLVQESAPLSLDDPALLFTIAGMVPLRSFFLGQKKPPAPRLVSCQLCLRANDMDKVGKTPHHHTFFEMLGNFSLGDYFKDEACQWGWEFVVKELGVEGKRIWITIFQDDDETHLIWKKIGIPSSKILRKGESDNFWSSGKVGPCGPDTEIFFDRGEEFTCRRKDCQPGCGCSRWVELWNLVFMQFNRDEEGRLSSLPSKNIDTGMGLERTASVVQGVEDDYETDLFRPVLEWLMRLLPEPVKDKVGIRAICDHLRALTFLLGEGIFPSNVGRGYVVRRILRRACRFGRRLGLEEPFLYQGVPVVTKFMEGSYPYLTKVKEDVATIIRAEEENFRETLSRGMRILEGIIYELKRKKKRLIPPSQVFKLYDTYGFPLDLTEEIAGEEGIRIDRALSEGLLAQQRERGRKEFREEKIGIRKMGTVQFPLLKEKVGESEFVGYERLTRKTRLLAILKNRIPVDELKEGEEGVLVLASTPFYPEGGGQVGDRGKIFTSRGLAQVLDVQRIEDAIIVHQVKMLKGRIRQGEEPIAKVDEERRKAIARAHTATHLLQAALREILGRTVKQSGSLVDEDRLRFDFTHFSPLSVNELHQVSSLLNEKIRKNLPVRVKEMSLSQAQERGAIALFEPKYEETVRVVNVGKFSMEVCGGTHLARSGEIGLLKIISESAVAAGVRRIEAAVGKRALEWMEERDALLSKIASELGTSEEEISTRLREREEDLEEKIRQLKRWQKRWALLKMEQLMREASEVGRVKVVSGKWDAVDPEVLREAAEKLRGKLRRGIVILASVFQDKALLVAASTHKNLPANLMVKELAQLVGGNGGGRWDFAQGGTSSPQKVDEALKQVPVIIERLYST
ncbi:Alanine--tRNA ligase [subsurface metagenome]